MKVFVGLSGGVDSAVSAYLLKQGGHDVHGVFMKNWEDDDTNGLCSAAQDLSDAQAVCQNLKIPLHTVNFSEDYWNHVFLDFIESYRSGITPNPDILCNKEIKFKAFLEHCLSLGADKVATGHYTQCTNQHGRWQLRKGTDPNKDQSYFLYTITQHALSKVLFPIGAIHKIKVREIARIAGFYNHNKKDSTGICFIGEKRFKDFLSNYIENRPGTIETPEGRIIGEHEGLMYYTLGQRQGLAIGGRQDSSGAPWYVVGKDVPRRALIVVQGQDHPWHFSTQLHSHPPHWIAGFPPSFPYRCEAKVRYRQAPQTCTIFAMGEGLAVEFDKPQRAVTPGQSIVFYQEDVCLGGAVIATTNSAGGIKKGALHAS